MSAEENVIRKDQNNRQSSRTRSNQQQQDEPSTTEIETSPTTIDDDGSANVLSKDSSSSTLSSLSPNLHQQQPTFIPDLDEDVSIIPNLNNIANLKTLSKQLEEANQLLDEKLTSIDQQIDLKQAKITEIETQVQQLQAQLDELNNTYEEESKKVNKADADEIEKLLTVFEKLKSDEKQFKQSCNAEMERLQLQSLLEQSTKSNDEEFSEAELQQQLEKAERKIDIGKEELGEINRKLAMIQRQIEQIPHRVELREYRLRFTELYNQVSATHRQTKQYFSLYNSLEDSKRYLEKEHSLLNSIIDSYQEVGSNASGREEFHKQLSHIHDGLKETCSKIERRFKSEKVVVDKLQHDLQNLLDQKVNYERCLKELDSDCKLNDKLLQQLKQIENEELQKQSQQQQETESP